MPQGNPEYLYETYFNNLVQKYGIYGARFPTYDEILHASEITRILSRIAQEHYIKDKTPLRILDVGCNRGWLTYLLNMYGDAEGIEATESVFKIAQQTFPNCKFTLGTPQTLLDTGHDEAFDIVISNNDIEHIPYPQQDKFAQALFHLTKPKGQVLLTTPRGEMYDIWIKYKQKSLQPVEDWLTEKQLDKLLVSSGFTVVFRRRFMLYENILPDSKLHRLAHKILTSLWYEYVEPKKFMTYQIVQLRK